MRIILRSAAGLFLCLSLGVGCSNKGTDSSSKQNGPKPPEIVDVIVAGYDRINDALEVNGSIVANEVVELHPEVSGRLTYLRQTEGELVKEGEVLARINDAELQAQLAKYTSQFNLAQKKEERYKKLLSANGINQADYDLALNELNNIKADIQLVQAQIDKTVLKAPFSGMLGIRNVSPGAYVTPQQVITVIQQLSSLKLDFTVPQEFDGLLKKGTEIKVKQLNDSVYYKAQIIAKETSINTATGNIKIRAVLKEGNFTPGAFVKVFVDAGSQKDRIIVPSNAIIPDVTSKKLIVVKNGKGVMKNVQTGIRTSYGVEITEGISTGDSVVVNGVLFVKPDAPVKVRSVLQLNTSISSN